MKSEKTKIDMKKEALDRANEFFNQFPLFKYALFIGLICGIVLMIVKQI